VRFSSALRVALAACSLITIALVVVVYRDMVAPEWLFAWLFVETAFAAIWRQSFHRVLHAIDTPERDLGLLAGVLARIESEQFTSPRMMRLHQTLLTDGVNPSVRIAELRKLVSRLDSTHNMMFAPIAFVLLLRQQFAVAIDRWHAAYGPAVAQWLQAVGEVEALGALATFAYERPQDPFPELASGEPIYEADELGHPLIDPSVAVRNDVRLGGAGPRVIIVSGSNMSGKSTLLRTVGINAVLALAGAPVAAARLRISPVQIAATLHIQDSLLAGRSRFWAEVVKLRQILELAREPRPVLFLIDEIFHGTNSHDRQVGGAALIERGLLARGVIGLVTTHDQVLSVLGERLAPRIQNVHFTDYIKDGAIEFDYRLRAGAVQHSNALELMRSIGVDV
jgi:DNA mismatch repair ATPase MutS